jgi:hypothetical protein
MTNPNTQNSTPVTDALRSIGTAFNTLKETVAERRRIIGLSLSTTALLATGCSGTEATKPVSPDRSVTVPAAAEQTAVPLEPSLSGGHTNKAPDKKDTGPSAADRFTLATIENEAVNAMLKANPRVSREDAVKIAKQQQGAWFKKAAQRAEVQGALDPEISDDEASVLKSLGLGDGDYSAVNDLDAPLPGPIEAGKASFNAGKTVGTPQQSVEQLVNLLSAKDGFSEEQANVVKEALQNNGAPQAMLDELAAGDLSSVEVSFVTLTADSAEYKNIGFNQSGKLSYDDLRSVGAEDAIALISYTDANGDTYVSAYRADCGWQPFQKVVTPQEGAPAPAPETPQAAPAPETPKADTPTPTPNQPAPPKADTPTPTPNQPAPPEEFTYTTSVCVGLLGNGQEQHEEFTGVGNTENEAKADANRQAKDAKGDCTPEETTTSTSTTTTAPTTTTGTSTTLPPIEVTTTTGVTVSTAPPTTPSTAPPTTPSTAPPTTPSTAPPPTTSPPPPPTTSPPPPPTTSPPPPPTTSPPPPPTTRPPVTEPPKTCESNPELCPTITVTPTIPEGPSGTAQPPATVLGFARSKFDSARTKADAKLGKLVTDAVQAGLGRLGNAAERANRANRANR